MDSKLIGSQIALLRKEKGLTQNELGDRLGVSFQADSRFFAIVERLQYPRCATAFLH